MITDFLIVIALGMGGGGALALVLRRVFRRPAPHPEKVMARRSGPPNQGSGGRRPPTSVNFVIVSRLVPR